MIDRHAAQPFRNFNKRIIKTPKLYFYDTGLACWLLAIRSAEQLNTHAMRGHLFESWVVSELLKGRFNRALTSDLYFWQDRGKNEVDVLIEQDDRLRPVEIKSGSTFRVDFLRGLHRWAGLAGKVSVSPTLVYGGDEAFAHHDTRVLPWHQVDEVLVR